MSVWTHDEPDEQIVQVGDLVVIVPPSRTIYIPHESDRDMQRACSKTGKSWRVATQAGDIQRPMVALGIGKHWISGAPEDRDESVAGWPTRPMVTE